MEPDRLYESPFTDFNPLGVEGLFKPAEITELFTVLNQIRASAA
jgi:type I restriction enzyme, R subunit